MKKPIFIFIVTLLGIMVSCDNFDVSNINPDVASDISNNPELLLTNSQYVSIWEAVNISWKRGNVMAQYGARIVFTEFDLFEWGDQAGTWKNFYLAISDAKELERIAEEKSLLGFQGVAKVMQVWLFGILTDMWGDIPYSEVALAGEGVYLPKYDTQEAIYTNMLEELKKANEYLRDSETGIKGDMIFDNDLIKWRKFANSLRLRHALRLSKADPLTAQHIIREIYNDPLSYPIMDSNADNAKLVFGEASPDAHPITEESAYMVGTFNEGRISEQFVGLLALMNDPRLNFFADPTTNSVENGTPEIQGMQNGIVDGPAYEYKGGDAFLSKFNINYFYYQPSANNARLMLYSEVEFILAEAAQRGWINGNGNDFYENGIRANFEYWDVEMPSDYLARTGVAYDNNLETIIKQKYISLFYIDFQGFIEFKRTGYPVTIKPGPDALYDIYPSRFEYPSEEESLNKVNYETAANRIGEDKITTKVWWEK